MDIEAGTFSIDAGMEDVHSQVEYLLTQKLGDVGKKYMREDLEMIRF